MKTQSGNKRIWIYTISVLVMVAAIIGTSAFLLQKSRAMEPQTNVAVLDNERSKVLVTGTDYKLHDDQKKELEREEKKERKKKQIKRDKKKPEVWKKTAPTKKTVKKSNKKTDSGKKKDDNEERNKEDPDDPDNTDVDDPDDVRDNERDGDDEKDLTEEERAKLPVITTSLINGDEVSGTKKQFWVTAKDYKGRDIPVFSVSDGRFTVSLADSNLTSTGASGGKTYFKPTLADGKNTFKITAIDREGRKRTITRWVTCNASGEAEIVGHVNVKISANIIGKGTLYSTDVDITEGDSVKDVMETAFAKGGFTGVFSGNYLAGIKKKDIAKNYTVSDEVKEKLEEERATEKDPAKQDPDSLKEHDIYSTSGWLYSVNGTMPDANIGSFIPDDGDDIEIIFALSSNIY